MALQPAIEFKGVLITRGGGTGAKRVMEQNPERAQFIKSFTGWERVESGTLTLDHANPSPGDALIGIEPLAVEPRDLLKHLTPNDIRIASKRGNPSYYGGIAHAGALSRRVVLSQQPSPAVPHRLEIVADVRLRDALQVKDGDSLHIHIFAREEWSRLAVDDLSGG